MTVSPFVQRWLVAAAGYVVVPVVALLVVSAAFISIICTYLIYCGATSILAGDGVFSSWFLTWFVLPFVIAAWLRTKLLLGVYRWIEG